MKIIVTAGPTREYFDPVRFLSNPSSGKMGYALAQKAKERGHEIFLITGPSSLTPPKNVELIRIESALQMQKKVLEKFDWADGVIMTAAISDFRPEQMKTKKIKKEGAESLEVKLIANPDILAELGKQKKSQWLVGFAAETDNVLENASKKMNRKNLDMIVANDISQKQAGFEADTNIVQILYKDGQVEGLPKMTKLEIADKLIEKIESKFPH